MSHSLLEKITDIAYETWERANELRKGKKIPYLDLETYLDEAGPVERAALRFHVFNGQVCNGGFAQWVQNGYATRYERLAADLLMVGTPPARRVAEIVTSVGDLLAGDRFDFRSDVTEYNEHDEPSDAFLALMDGFDRSYYDIREVLLRDIDASLMMMCAQHYIGMCIGTEEVRLLCEANIKAGFQAPKDREFSPEAFGFKRIGDSGERFVCGYWEIRVHAEIVINITYGGALIYCGKIGSHLTGHLILASNGFVLDEVGDESEV